MREQILQAVQYFGPLNCAEIKEKLEMRNIQLDLTLIRWFCLEMVEDKTLREADGFSVLTFKI